MQNEIAKLIVHSIKSEVQLIYVQLNFNIKKMDRRAQVTMVYLAIMDHRLIVLDH